MSSCESVWTPFRSAFSWAALNLASMVAGLWAAGAPLGAGLVSARLICVSVGAVSAPLGGVGAGAACALTGLASTGGFRGEGTLTEETAENLLAGGWPGFTVSGSARCGGSGAG